MSTRRMRSTTSGRRGRRTHLLCARPGRIPPLRRSQPRARQASNPGALAPTPVADASSRGEMPFLDHLEELRWRLLKILLAIVVGTVIGWFVVERVDVIGLLMRPIAPH